MTTTRAAAERAEQLLFPSQVLCKCRQRFSTTTNQSRLPSSTSAAAALYLAHRFARQKTAAAANNDDHDAVCVFLACPSCRMPTSVNEMRQHVMSSCALSTTLSAASAAFGVAIGGIAEQSRAHLPHFVCEACLQVLDSVQLLQHEHSQRFELVLRCRLCYSTLPLNLATEHAVDMHAEWTQAQADIGRLFVTSMFQETLEMPTAQNMMPAAAVSLSYDQATRAVESLPSINSIRTNATHRDRIAAVPPQHYGQYGQQQLYALAQHYEAQRWPQQAADWKTMSYRMPNGFVMNIPHYQPSMHQQYAHARIDAARQHQLIASNPVRPVRPVFGAPPNIVIRNIRAIKERRQRSAFLAAQRPALPDPRSAHQSSAPNFALAQARKSYRPVQLPAAAPDPIVAASPSASVTPSSSAVPEHVVDSATTSGKTVSAQAQIPPEHPSPSTVSAQSSRVDTPPGRPILPSVEANAESNDAKRRTPVADTTPDNHSHQQPAALQKNAPHGAENASTPSEDATSSLCPDSDITRRDSLHDNPEAKLALQSLTKNVRPLATFRRALQLIVDRFDCILRATCSSTAADARARAYVMLVDPIGFNLRRAVGRLRALDHVASTFGKRQSTTTSDDDMSLDYLLDKINAGAYLSFTNLRADIDTMLRSERRHVTSEQMQAHLDVEHIVGVMEPQSLWFEQQVQAAAQLAVRADHRRTVNGDDGDCGALGQALADAWRTMLGGNSALKRNTAAAESSSTKRQRLMPPQVSQIESDSGQAADGAPEATTKPATLSERSIARLLNAVRLHFPPSSSTADAGADRQCEAPSGSLPARALFFAPRSIGPRDIVWARLPSLSESDGASVRPLSNVQAASCRISDDAHWWPAIVRAIGASCNLKDSLGRLGSRSSYLVSTILHVPKQLYWLSERDIKHMFGHDNERFATVIQAQRFADKASGTRPLADAIELARTLHKQKCSVPMHCHSPYPTSN